MQMQTSRFRVLTSRLRFSESPCMDFRGTACTKNRSKNRSRNHFSHISQDTHGLFPDFSLIFSRLFPDFFSADFLRKIGNLFPMIFTIKKIDFYEKNREILESRVRRPGILSQFLHHPPNSDFSWSRSARERERRGASGRARDLGSLV